MARQGLSLLLLFAFLLSFSFSPFLSLFLYLFISIVYFLIPYISPLWLNCDTCILSLDGGLFFMGILLSFSLSHTYIYTLTKIQSHRIYSLTLRFDYCVQRNEHLSHSKSSFRFVYICHRFLVSIYEKKRAKRNTERVREREREINNNKN